MAGNGMHLGCAGFTGFIAMMCVSDAWALVTIQSLVNMAPSSYYLGKTCGRVCLTIGGCDWGCHRAINNDSGPSGFGFLSWKLFVNWSTMPGWALNKKDDIISLIIKRCQPANAVTNLRWSAAERLLNLKVLLGAIHSRTCQSVLINYYGFTFYIFPGSQGCE